MKKLVVVFILSAFTSFSQIALNNFGGGLTLQINNALVVHSDGDVANLSSATMVFGSTGEPNLEFHGDLTNATDATLTAGTGLIELTGSSNQDLDFGGDDLYNLEINNAAGGTFTSNVTVNNEVQFTNGDFTTGNTGTDSLLTFETSASATGASDASHVNGPVSKNFNGSAFTFPVGHGSSYNPLTFTPDAGTTTMQTKFNFAQPTNRDALGAGICKVSNVEYWDFTRTGGSAIDGTITLSWDTESGVSTTGDLLVAYWDGSNWIDGGGTASGTASSGTIPTGSTVSTFNKFTLGTDPCSSPLPVELLSFDAEKVLEDVDVTWITTTEINNDYFVIERSRDGITWESLDSVPGAGNSSVELSYDYMDDSPLFGTSFYRLKQVDFDGSFSYSEVEVINFEGIEIVDLYPNPSTGKVNYTLKASHPGTATLSVYDAISKLVVYEQFEVTEGFNYVNNVINAENGKYFISVTMANGKYYDYDVVLIK